MFSKQACPREKLLARAYLVWGKEHQLQSGLGGPRGKGKYQLPLETLRPTRGGGETTRNTAGLTVRSHRFTEGLRPHHRTRAASLPHPTPPISKDMLQQVLPPRTSCPAKNKKLQGLLKTKAQYEDTEQTSEPGMAGTLELWDQKCKSITTNMLKALM